MTIRELTDLFVRRRFVLLGTLLLGVVLTILLLAILHPTYTAQSSVLMVAQNAGGSNASPSPIEPILTSDLPLLATTPTVLERLAKDLHLRADARGIDVLTKRIKAHLATASSELGGTQDGGVLILTYQGPSEHEAVSGANELASEITNFYRDNATQRFSILIADLNQQMKLRRATTSALDQDIQKVLSDTPYLDTKDGSNALDTQYIKLSADRIDAAALASGDAEASAVTNRRPTEVSAAAHRDITETNPAYHDLRDQYARDLAKATSVQGGYSDAYPGLSEVQHDLAAEKHAMLAQEGQLRSLPPNASPLYANALGESNKARAIASGDAAHLRSIDSALATTRAQIDVAKSAGVRLATLQRDREVATTAYTVLATRLAEAVASKAEVGSVGSVIVLDDARFAKRSGNLVFASFVGFLLAVFAGLVTIALLEILDRRLRDKDTIERIYGIPVIGAVGR
jgi:capsular polysaccharide biosynthesis protein